ncbi:MAG: hypothetical protein JNJ44_07790 [Zoogloeaceae bacterium]|nr:hypothetical protein [Zoogloeaceae bacterium]
MLIDPLGVFGTPRVHGFNALKPHLDHHYELARWEAARRRCSLVGIFGNSRAEIGFDPAEDAFTTRKLTAFNHAIPGSNITVAARQFGWLSRVGCAPKRVVLGLEFFDFLGSPAAEPTDPSTFPTPGKDWRFMREVVFSLTGLLDSFSTIAIQSARYPATITEAGFNPLFNYRQEVENSGHYVLFRQRAVENVKAWQIRASRPRLIAGRLSLDQTDLENFLRQATAAGSEVDLVIYPYHAEIRLVMERLNLSHQFAEWKRGIVATAARFSGQDSSMRVWDFSALQPETLEPIPPPGDRTSHLKWYWEGGHFKKALGAKVLDRLLGASGNFGQQLNPANIDAWLESDREGLQEFLQSASPLVAEVDSVISSTATKSN